jgi:serine/threonine-protein kinase
MNPVDDRQLAELQAALAGVYSIERSLGRGGMGTVYLARDVSLDRAVAIKVLHREYANIPEQRARFLAEARTGARLTHPHIVPIFAVDTAGGWDFFVMGLIDGESLAHRIGAHGPLSADDAERALREVGWALGYAHAMGVLHRDVTLDNILIDRTSGRAVLVDFGIAAEIDGAEAAHLVGTPAYIAPELVSGAPPSVRSDLYALGICGWAMLAGRFPFGAAEPGATLLQHVTADLPSLVDAAPGSPRRLAGAITHALSRNPAERPDNVETFVAALDRPGTTAPALAPPLARWVARGERIRPAWAFAMPMAAVLTLEAFPNTLYALAQGYAADFSGLAGGIAIPVVAALALQVWVQCRELRLALRAGYTIDDLRLANRHVHDPRQAPVGLLGRLIHDAAWLAFIGLALIFVVVASSQRLFVDWRAALSTINHLASAMRPLWVILWTAIGAGFIIPVSPIRLGRAGGIGARFWNSRAGAWFARLAAVGLPRARAPEHTLHRPTELVLELAIDDLWTALPAATRRACAELPAVAESLRERVSQTRELMQQLAEPDLAPVPDAVALRERVQAQHDSAIVALERLRLELMQLSGAIAPTGALTEQLRGARALEAELLHDLGAHPRIDRLLRGATRRPSREVTPQTA